MVRYNRHSHRRGAVALELALVLSLVAIVVLSALVALSKKVTTAIGVSGDVVVESAEQTSSAFD